MKKATFVTAFLLLALARQAQADFSQNWNSGFQNGGVVPDGSFTGWSDTRTLSGAPAGPISDVSVSLTLSGGWNGDLYAYLVHDSGFAVLLNRPGRTGANAPGFSTSGMNVTFNDVSILGNIHAVGAPASGGVYQPDGRNIDPRSSGAIFDGTSPSALLSSFNGLNAASGSWTLFIADVSGGDQSTVTGWGLEIIAAVPEPSSVVEGTLAALFLGGLVGLYRLKAVTVPRAA